MGACASMVGELAGVEIPTIDIDLSSLKEHLDQFSAGIPITIAENVQSYRAECANLQTGEEYAVPNSTIKLTANSSDAEFTKAAVMNACGEQVRDMVKDQVWELAEPLIDTCLEAAMSSAPVPIPDMIIQKAKDGFRGSVVDPLTDKAIDKVMSVALKKAGCSAKEIEGCAASTASAKKDTTLTMPANGKTDTIDALSAESQKKKACCCGLSKKKCICIWVFVCLLLVVGVVAGYMSSNDGSCESHDECGDGEFCDNDWSCSWCEDCHSGGDGIDGTCGYCG